MKEKTKLTIHQLFWYFLIFSVLGLIIETIYCYITTGVLESRKGLIWGPFCPVYGVSAAILLLFLNRYKNKNIFSLFIYGIVMGSIAEYILSYGLEAIYGIRFWEYSYLKINLNGRICLTYSIYWGFLSVLLIKLVKPGIDWLIEKIDIRIKNILEIVILIFLVADCVFTIWGIQTYQNRLLRNSVNSEKTTSQFIKMVENEYFTNDRMSKTFPNLRIKDEKGNEIWLRTLIPNN